MQITNDTLIVSMTSWPRRIKYVAKALFSILKQNVDKKFYHLVLVLAESEFPNKEKDLPENLRLMIDNELIELIWYKRNILSHKKLMPTLAKYPENPILVCDEDIIRPEGWLKTFIEDHKKFPTDILVGGCVFDIAFDNGKFNPIKRFKFDDPRCAGKVIKNRRPANGFGGVLYPAHTFTDKRFYNEDLMMKLSEYSDESWQFCFNVIEGRIIRWISRFFRHDFGQQAGTYESSMSKIRSGNKSKSYNLIYENLFKEFPEFKEKLKLRLK